MDNPVPHTAAWEAFVLVSFAVATGMLALGIWNMQVDWWVRGYLAMGSMFSVGATATLTKTLRDKAEWRARRGDLASHSV